MKWHFALLAISFPFAAQANVTSATLYPSHAQLVWEESSRLQQGSGQLTLSGLPVGLEEPTLVAELQGVAGVVIQRVQVRQVEQAEVVANKTRELQQQLREIEYRIGGQEDQIQAWNQQVTLMSGAAGKPGELKAAELAQMAETVQKTTLEALKQVRQIRQEMASDIAERDRIKRELAATQQNSRATKSVTITYQARQGGDVTVRLKYQTHGASWRSQYNARLNAEQNGQDGTLVLEHLAVIRQNTGTSWDDVKLTLSTANARLGSDIPPLSPWMVSPGVRPEYRSKAALQSTSDEVQPEMISQAQAARFQSEGAFTQSYVVESPVSVVGDNTEQYVTVASHNVPVSLEARLFPSLDTNAFVHASGTFEADISLPPGAVSLYRDGQSVGSTYTESLAPGSELAMGFGVNDRVTAKVVSEENKKGEQGVFKGEKYLRQVNRYDITNHHSKPVTVRVFDRLPVSRQDDLTVEALDISQPVTRNYQDKKGVLAWERGIQPGNTIQLKAGFELRVPEESELPPDFQ